MTYHIHPSSKPTYSFLGSQGCGSRSRLLMSEGGYNHTPDAMFTPGMRDTFLFKAVTHSH